MFIEIWVKDIQSEKKTMFKEIQNNRFVEYYLSSEKGVLEAGPSKPLSLNDVYALAGRASMYLANYKEPNPKSSTGITSSFTTQKIEEMRDMKLQAKSCFMIAKSMLEYMNPNWQLTLKVKR
jgi:hypothetical protein